MMHRAAVTSSLPSCWTNTRSTRPQCCARITHTHTPRRRKSLHSITAKSSHEKQEAAGFFPETERCQARALDNSVPPEHDNRRTRHQDMKPFLNSLSLDFTLLDGQIKQIEDNPQGFGKLYWPCFFFCFVFFLCVCELLTSVCRSVSVCIFLAVKTNFLLGTNRNLIDQLSAR